MRFLSAIAVLAAGLLAPMAGAAEPPDNGARFYRTMVGAADAVKRLEFVQMLQLIVKRGANMGPGDGWFKPAEARYDWKWLLARYDADHDDRITEKELASPELFRRLDRNRDGVLTAEDFDWSGSSPFARQMGQAADWLRQADTDGDRRVSKAEFDALFKQAAQGKEYLNAEDVRALLFPPSPPRPKSVGPPSDMPTKATLLKGLFNGEIGSPCEGPRLGDLAPDFTLKSSDGLKDITLSKIIGPKPVVLIFGSFT